MCFGHGTFLGGRRDSHQCLAPTELADVLALAVHKRFPRITAELAPTTRVPRSPDWLPGDSAIGANTVMQQALRCSAAGFWALRSAAGAPSGARARDVIRALPAHAPAARAPVSATRGHRRRANLCYY